MNSMHKNNHKNPPKHKLLISLAESKADLKKHRYHASLEKHMKEVTPVLSPAS